jgi:hypothetical protein
MKFKDYLGDFMDRRNKEYIKHPELAAADRDRFRRAVENCWIVFAAAAFRKTADAKKSAPLADAVMISLADYPADVIAQKAANIRAAVNGLLTGEGETQKEFQKAFGTGTNGKGAIRIRIELAKEAVKAAVAQ